MPRCRKKPTDHDDRCEHDTSQSPVRNGAETRKRQHSVTHTYPSPISTHLHPSTPDFEGPTAGPSGLSVSRRHSHCCSSSHTARSTSTSSSSRSDYAGRDSDSSSLDGGDYPPYRATYNTPAPIVYWLVGVHRRFKGFADDLRRSLCSIWLHLPLHVLLFRGDYQPLRRKALMVAGLTLLGLGFWFGVPILFRNLSSRSVNTGSGTNLAKIQEQLTDIQKQLAEKEARWKETLLKEIGSLQSEEKMTSDLKMEFSNWLQEYLFTGSSSDAEGVVLWPELKVVLESMETRLVQQLATSQDVRKTVKEALSRYNADGIGMTDYALIFSGGKVITSRYTKPYCPQSLQLCSQGPSAVIEPEVYPGKCWAFRGSYGSVTIALSQSVRITHVTMEHLPKSLSPTGQIDSAPQDFAVYGIHHVAQKQEGVFLGKFAYSKDGDPVQTFELKDPLKNLYPVVELRILTNWGNPVYTCVYRFRVHDQAKNA